jgi:hypothetical protein
MDIITEPTGSKEGQLLPSLLKVAGNGVANAITAIVAIFAIPFCFFNEKRSRNLGYDKDVKDIF